MMRQRNQDETGTTGAQVKRRHPLRTFAVAFASFIAASYALGFVAFVSTLPRAQASDDAQADAIVALTGDGGRLAPAVALLEMGNGGRLLITGVNKVTSKTALKPLLKGGPSFDCCADLGFAASDTRGNAEEAASWAHDHHYRSLIVVTASYHMPRSLLEFSAEMPDVKLVPFPVAVDAPATLSWQNAKRLQGEYIKFLASWIRVVIFGAARHA
jgi:uncharacterized SAM-binding protein YcdF (DUF218 family)